MPSEQRQFPAVEDIILISDAYAALSKIRAEKLLAWVEQGGHLMISASNPFIHNPEQQPDEIFGLAGKGP